MRGGRYREYDLKAVRGRNHHLKRDISRACNTYSVGICVVLLLDHDGRDYSNRRSMHLFHDRGSRRSLKIEMNSVCNNHDLATLARRTWLGDQRDNWKPYCRINGTLVLLPT